MTVGNHTLTVVKERYASAERMVTVVENRTMQITISLVSASPPLVDTLRAAGPAPATLIAGFYDSSGYQVFAVRIAKSANVSTRISL